MPVTSIYCITRLDRACEWTDASKSCFAVSSTDKQMSLSAVGWIGADTVVVSNVVYICMRYFVTILLMFSKNRR